VPGFVEAYENFIESARKFIQLTHEKQAKYTPEDVYGRGWPYEIETFNDVTDSFKGSYYATYPESHGKSPNIWPYEDIPDFKENYLNLVKTIFNTGKQIQPLVDISINNTVITTF